MDYNPDVLTCLANLSNDEVFTPPTVVNQMLDLLPQEIWSDSSITFLDPFTKTGVFLREIAKRLIKGLENEFPDQQDRINHIFKNQIFGIAITELTSLLARRSVYCTKDATSKYSIVEGFKNEQGNIIFNKVEHVWEGNKCKFCGASKEVYERDNELETHAYEFIHTNQPEKIFNMRFDVIIGNPPYQLSDGGGTGSSAIALYNKFVQQAIKLQPRYLSMIIPARWYSGGKGLDEFRNEMLSDKRISHLVDYFDSTECFPGVDISGGICYFLWEKDYLGECNVVNIRHGIKNELKRSLLEKGLDTFIRFNESVSIVQKVNELNEDKITKIISSRKPFGLTSSIKPSANYKKDYVKIFSYPNDGYISREKVLNNTKWIDEYKVYIAKAYGERGNLPYNVIGKPFIGERNTCCSETYLVIGPVANEKRANNIISYINTKFFRFLVLLKKNTQNAAKNVYGIVPMQDWEESWDDEKLYKKYNLNSNEINLIEKTIKSQ
ncbi:Eco57I restriction-modification methylase domain-containing protein [Empedobacter sp.]|uniref:Eco57I restriction-modification methylase domain-containing protein n=1 Tax=Empedobacter sp. TaxID=1927715 RepID=UPI0028AA09FB|nr:Eco57I restriction-modification methylase domain-containing protein [Empedobacter sp.]